MENFKKFSCETKEDGTIITDDKLMARSLVLINANGALYNITAKVRNTDKFSVIRALAKAVLADKRANLLENNDEDVKHSKNRESCKLNAALSCHKIAVTDKNGNILMDSILSVEDYREGGKLRNIMKFNQTMPVYKLVVKDGLDWSNENVVTELNTWVNAAIKHLDYDKRADKALGEAADSTDKEEKAAEAAAKKMAA